MKMKRLYLILTVLVFLLCGCESTDRTVICSIVDEADSTLSESEKSWLKEHDTPDLFVYYCEDNSTILLDYTGLVNQNRYSMFKVNCEVRDNVLSVNINIKDAVNDSEVKDRLTARISSKEDIDEVKIYLDGVEVEYIEG